VTAIAAVEPIVVNVSSKTNWTFIAVTTDEGATGWGECSLNGWEHLLVPQAQALARDAVGRELAAVGGLVRYFAHSPGGLVAHAVKSAVEQALVDLRAARAGQSIARFLTASPRAAVPAYANINRGVKQRTTEGFADAARRAVAAGYRAVKLAPFDGVIAEDATHTPIDARTRAGLDCVFAVRDAVGPQTPVMVDCHWRFDVERAERMLRDIAPAQPYWVECMTSEHPACFPAVARLTESPGRPVATETCKVRLSMATLMASEGRPLCSQK
jgi:galactonate dehydratase